MNQLSEQLEAVAKAPGICVHPGYVEVLRRAIALAKRYEAAPMESVGALPGSNGGFGAVCLPREFVGQRVRIVLDKEG